MTISTAPEKPSRYRWRVIALLFLATTINYVDRQTLSFIMTDDGFKRTLLGLADHASITDEHLKAFRIQMGLIDSAFKATYAIGFLIVGWLIDRIGTKKGFSLGMIVWSIASLLSTFVNTFGQLRLVRALLGLGEAANFPSAMKAISEWFPRHERSTATGFLNAGSNMGVIVTAALIPVLVLDYGWRVSFLVSALLGFLMLFVWLIAYQQPRRTTLATEQESVSTNEPKLPWRQLFRHRQTWVFACSKIFADPVWFFYLTWLPDFLLTNNQLDRKLDLKNFGIPFLIIYLVSDVGSIFFGWMATRLMERGWSENSARKSLMLVCALTVVPIYLTPSVHSFSLMVTMLAVATAAHQGWSSNAYALAATLFPKNAVGSATGLGGFLGGLTSMGVAAATGYVVAAFGYKPMFIFASFSYLVGLTVMHLILPKLRPIEFNQSQQLYEPHIPTA